MSAAAIIRTGQAVACRPWARYVLPAEDWAAMAAALANDPLELVALWSDTAQIHALFTGPDGPLLASTAVSEGRYSALSPYRPAAAGFERMVYDLWGHEAAGAADTRGLLDHGGWAITSPMAIRPTAPNGPAEPVLLTSREGLHQIPLGPVLPGIAEPAHLRLHADGETVVRAEARLGYAHKGVLLLIRGKSPRAAARFAARLSGDATVAHAIAFARAAEAALGIDAPARAHALRGVMAELERAASHLGDLAGLCGDAAFAYGHARFGVHREALLRAAADAFGHRLMMDLVIPGGIASDIAPDGAAAILIAMDDMVEELADLTSLYEGSSGLADRMAGLGRVPPLHIAAFAPGGVAGRAAGRDVDARRTPGYPPYDGIAPPILAAGDVDARVRIRLAELTGAAALLHRLLDTLPGGPVNQALPTTSGEGIGVAESARGDVWHWLRLDAGMIATAFAADASWRLWPLMELAARDGGVADFPIIARSFAGSCSGVDL
jgi:Ni,Fe-hydrogenase III large subunit